MTEPGQKRPGDVAQYRFLVDDLYRDNRRELCDTGVMPSTSRLPYYQS